MTRVDLAIDYYNTNLKVEPLANGVILTKESKCGISNIIDGLTVMMSNAHGGARAHEITGKALKPYWTPEWSKQIR